LHLNIEGKGHSNNKLEGNEMRKHELHTDYHDHFEYFGNTEIERIRKQGEKTIRHDWIIFDSADEAMEYFNDRSGEIEGYYA
jgi:hypothetical protein